MSSLAPARAYEYFTPGDTHPWPVYWANSVFADGRIAVCFEGGTPVDTNKNVIAQGMNIWSQHMPALLTKSLGSCQATDVYEVRILWSDLTFFNDTWTCAKVWAWTQYESQSRRTVHYNSLCANWHWIGPNQALVPAGKISAYSVAAHEFGHAGGLAHDDGGDGDPNGIPNATSDLMDDPAAPMGQHCHMSRDDAYGMQKRYPGLAHGNYLNYPVNRSCFN